VFASPFLEGLPAGKGTVGESNKTEIEGSYPKIRFKLDDDFDLFHNILYYIYTGCINFSSDLTLSNGLHSPNLCSPEDIYTLADRLLLDELKAKAVKFLQLTCTVTNITPRIMSKFADLHEDVASMYDSYFRSHWEVIKCTTEFEQFFDDIDGENEEISRVFTKFRKLMRNSSFDSPTPLPVVRPLSAEDRVLQQMAAAQM
jgi:hypothetical protein